MKTKTKPKFDIGEKVFLLKDWKNGDFTPIFTEIIGLSIDSNGQFSYDTKRYRQDSNSDTVFIFKTKEELINFVAIKLDLKREQILKHLIEELEYSIKENEKNV